MVDITVFRMEIDDSTFNAPFGGRAQSDGAPPSADSSESGPGIKLIAGLGAVLVLTLLVLGVLLKRRFGSSENEDEETTDAHELDEYEADDDEQERGGIRATIGLSFLVAMTALQNHWNRSEQNETATHPTKPGATSQ